MSSQRSYREYTIAIIGPTGVGKSSLCLQFTRNYFTESYEPTEADYFRKPITMNNIEIMLNMLDTAGQVDLDAELD